MTGLVVAAVRILSASVRADRRTAVGMAAVGIGRTGLIVAAVGIFGASVRAGGGASKAFGHWQCWRPCFLLLSSTFCFVRRNGWSR